MQGVVLLGQRTVELREFPEPVPGPAEVVVAIKASGMCGTDLHQYRGHLPKRSTNARFIGGHEPCGVVLAVGAGVLPSQAEVGQRVMVHHYKGCNACPECRSGWPQMCTKAEPTVYGTSGHGSHAALMLVPATSVVALPDPLSFQGGAAIGCGTGTAWGALQRLGDVGGSTIAVFGQGPVGLSATMLATALGGHVIAIDTVQSRLDRASRLGAAHVVNAADPNVVAAVRELSGGRGPQLCLETSGATEAASAVIDVLAPWGRACFVGIGAAVAFEVIRQMHKQLTLMTSWTMSVVDLQRCADFVVERQVPVDELFTHSWNLSQASEAYAEFDRQSAGKGVFVL